MNDTLAPAPGQVLVWDVRGHRVDPDGTERSVIGTSFGRTEARARENWRTTWGNGIEWPVERLTFTWEGGAL